MEILNKRAAPSEKSAIVHTHNAQIQIILYHPGLCSPFIHSVVSNASVSGQGRL